MPSDSIYVNSKKKMKVMVIGIRTVAASPGQDIHRTC